MFITTRILSQFRRNRRTWLAMTLALLAYSSSPQLTSAETLVIDINLDPGQAETAQIFEVTMLEDVDSDHLHSFIQECQFRAASTQLEWYLAAVADDDLMTCRSRGASNILDMDLSITQDPEADASSSGPDPEAEIIARFEPELGDEVRVRFSDEGWSWSDWTTGRIERSLYVPEDGQEHEADFEVEIRQVTFPAAISVGGYVKIKKLNSGD